MEFVMSMNRICISNLYKGNGGSRFTCDVKVSTNYSSQYYLSLAFGQQKNVRIAHCFQDLPLTDSSGSSLGGRR